MNVPLSPSNGTATQIVTAALTGLAPRVTHHYRLTASNAADPAATSGGTFTTLTLVEDWRLSHFGTSSNTGIAAETTDPDCDGDKNLFEFVAGLLPNDSRSRFRVRIEMIPNQLGRKAIIFSPLVAGRTYAVQWKAALTDAAWLDLANISTNDSGVARTVTDLGESDIKRIYRVVITNYCIVSINHYTSSHEELECFPAVHGESRVDFSDSLEDAILELLLRLDTDLAQEGVGHFAKGRLQEIDWAFHPSLRTKGLLAVAPDQAPGIRKGLQLASIKTLARVIRIVFFSLTPLAAAGDRTILLRNHDSGR